MTHRRLRQAQSLARTDDGSLSHNDVENDQEIQIELAQMHVIQPLTAAKSQQQFRSLHTIHALYTAKSSCGTREAHAKRMKEFPPFKLDVVNQCLWRVQTAQNERVQLTPKGFQLLRHLVEHAGRLVTHEEVIRSVWSRTCVEPEGLKQHVCEIRKVLGDRAKQPRFIETHPRRGYRFIAPVKDSVFMENTTAPGSPLAQTLVGRDAALTELQDCLRRVMHGQRQIVFVTGEPGIGKTALADEFQRLATAEVASLRIGRGQCIEGYGGIEAYYPVLEALAQLCRGTSGAALLQTLAAPAPTWLVQLPALINGEQCKAFRHEIVGGTPSRMLREMSEALEAITTELPLLLVFEDLHWADHPTVDLISALA